MQKEKPYYSPDACFRSYKVQDAIKGFTNEEIQQVRIASHQGYAYVLDAIRTIRHKKDEKRDFASLNLSSADDSHLRHKR